MIEKWTRYYPISSVYNEREDLVIDHFKSLPFEQMMERGNLCHLPFNFKIRDVQPRALHKDYRVYFVFSTSSETAKTASITSVFRVNAPVFDSPKTIQVILDVLPTFCTIEKYKSLIFILLRRSVDLVHVDCHGAGLSVNTQEHSMY